MGLSESRNGVLAHLLAATDDNVPFVLSLCLALSGGWVALGGVDTSVHLQRPSWTALTSYPGSDAYDVHVAALSFAGVDFVVCVHAAFVVEFALAAWTA